MKMQRATMWDGWECPGCKSRRSNLEVLAAKFDATDCPCDRKPPGSEPTVPPAPGPTR